MCYARGMGKRLSRRQEMLLTFSPGEWIWVVGAFATYGSIILLTW